MLSYREQVEEFENNFLSVVAKPVIDLSSAFDALCSNKDSKGITQAIDSAKSLLSYEYNIPTKMQLYYDISNAHHDLRKINGDHKHHLEKELYYLRYCLDMYEKNYFDSDDSCAEVKVAQYIAMRAYTNIGNTYKALGRYIAAIDSFQNALLINDAFAMASLNLSFSLFEYGQLQIQSYEQGYFYHACYHYYKQTEYCKINLESQEYLKDLESCIYSFNAEFIENYLCKPLSLPPFQVDNQDEADYRNYLLMYRLFLDPRLEILSDPCFAVDSINLPFKEPYSNIQKEFIGLFNQIKQEFNWARFLWYKASTDEPCEHYADKELDLVDTCDLCDHSLRDSILRTAFKTAYAVFDRIGFFINQYFEVGLLGTIISFKNVWKEKLISEKGDAYYTIPNPIMEAHSDNPFVKAMYWLQKDFYENEKITVTAPGAERIFQMRNDMEHNCLRTGTKAYDISFTKYTNEYEIENNTFRLLKLARELIIYLCLAVNLEQEKGRKAQ